MKVFECEKCKGKEVFIDKTGNNIGLYCADCGKWVKWLNKDELRLAERQIKAHDREIRNKAIDEFSTALKELIEKERSIPDLSEECKRCGIWKIWDIKVIAEKLKGGAE